MRRKKENQNKREFTAKKIFAVAAIIFFGIATVATSITAAGLIYSDVNNKRVASQSVDNITDKTQETNSVMGNFIASYRESVNTFNEDLNDDIGKLIPFNETIKKGYGRFLRTIGKQVAVDELYITCMLDNGYLSYATKQVDLTRYAQNLIEFRDACTQAGSDFLFVLNPSKADGTAELFPKGITNYYNENKQTLLAELDKTDMRYICTSDIAKENGLDICELFFKTDHHWLPTTGLWVAGEVANELNTNYGYNFDLNMFDIENYNVTTYKKLFYGSQGKKMCYGYTQAEDFDVIEPKFDTNFTFWSESTKGVITEKEGTFSQTVIKRTDFSSDYSTANDNAYATYMSGDRPIVKLENLNCKNGKRILILKTSLANVIIPFLACGDVQYIDVLDLRMYSKSATDYLNETKPDTVIVMYGLPYYSLSLTAESCSWKFK